MGLLDLFSWIVEEIEASVRLGQSRSRLQRMVARVRRSEIRDVGRDERAVRIVGRVDGRTFLCPVTGIEVLGFHVRAELEPHDQQRPGETYLIDLSVVADFTVHDDTGCALVRGAASSLGGSGGVRARDQLAVDLVNPAFAELVERQASVVDVVTSRVAGYWLHELHPGDEATVCGRARLELDVSGGGGYREVPSHPVLEAASGVPLIIVVGST